MLSLVTNKIVVTTFQGGNLKTLVFVALLATTSFSFVQTEKSKNTGLIGHAVGQTDKGYYGMAGCGLGSVLFGESENRGGQILSSTTNGLYSNNTFGMSSGSSNCIPEKSARTAEVKKNMNMFIDANKEALANDIVKRDGETILALGEIVGCKDTNYLGAKLQSRYGIIYDKTDSNSVTNNMYDVIVSDKYLIENCKL